MNIPARTRSALEVQAQSSLAARKVLLPVQEFMHIAGLSGGVLLLAAIVALIWANSPWRASYADLWHLKITVAIGSFSISEDLHHWVNDGLMAIFFFVMGLEIKREIVRGELSQIRQATLPLAAALGGMMLPALLFVAINAGTPNVRGWGVPMATDIAFALGVLALLGNRIPAGARVFLLALAIIDDIGAILVIAFFYTASLSLPALGAALALLVLIVVLQRIGVRTVGVYAVVGILFWAAFLKSGVHATLAGVILGLLTPSQPWRNTGSFADLSADLLERFRGAQARGDEHEEEAVLGEIEELTRETEAPLERLERALHPWASFVVLPLFALANCGVELSGEAIAGAASSRVTWGIAIGLIVGKTLGVVGFTWLVVRSRLAVLPSEVTWPHIIGIAMLSGIGFTVSLFITSLAFSNEATVSHAKIAILGASLLAGLAGYSFLRAVTQPVVRPSST